MGHDIEMVILQANTDIRFNVPLYTVAEAARTLGIPAVTLGAWTRDFEPQASVRKSPTRHAMVTTVAGEHGTPSIPFLGLVEGLVLTAIRRTGYCREFGLVYRAL